MGNYDRKSCPVYKKVEQWKIYDRIAGSGIYADVDKEFLPNERYDWTLLTEIELFKSTVKGCEKVLDVGCGTGHPSLYLASEVGSIIGIDKSERMIEIARNKLRRSGIKNVIFKVMDAQNLEFPGKSFDTVILCGSLATFSDKISALKEMRRVLRQGGRVACIEENWLYQTNQESRYTEEGSFTFTEKGLITYRYVERLTDPHKEIDYRCIIDSKNSLGRRLLTGKQLRKHKSLKTKVTIKEIEAYCSEIEYDEQEKFDAETIANLFGEQGFRDINVRGYGIMYDLLNSRALITSLMSHMKELCKAEASISNSLDPLKTEMLFLTCRL